MMMMPALGAREAPLFAPPPGFATGSGVLNTTISDGDQHNTAHWSMTEPSLPILLLDNYDSYTYNLHHLIAGACGGAPPLTVRNDTFQSWDELRRALPPFGAVVISPGPGNADKLLSLIHI